jgi:hypothetical protein
MKARSLRQEELMPIPQDWPGLVTMWQRRNATGPSREHAATGKGSGGNGRPGLGALPPDWPGLINLRRRSAPGGPESVEQSAQQY